LGINFKAQKVSVVNQFGKQELTVTRPQTLCVPSVKSKGSTPPAPMPRLVKLLDHFRCYAVEPVDMMKDVELVDQFTSTRSRVTGVVQLCNPVVKNSGQILRPKAHLVCYSITDVKEFRVVSVRVRNQFGLASLRALQPKTVCLPSFKNRLG
jgi:hypothetical protein